MARPTLPASYSASPSGHLDAHNLALDAIREIWDEIDAAVADIADAAADASAALSATTRGDHLITWTGSAWVYRGATVTERPSTPTYAQGARVVWDTSQDVTITMPPSLAINGDAWIPHGDVTPVV